MIHPSTRTTVVILPTILSLVHTVKILLLGKVLQNSRQLFVPCLNPSDGSESPAGSTTTLVLDGGHSTFLSPQHCLRGIRHRCEEFILGSFLDSCHVETEILFLFLRSHSREEVESVDSVVSSVFIVVGNMLCGLVEESVPERVFGGSEAEMVLYLELFVEVESSFRRPEDCS